MSQKFRVTNSSAHFILLTPGDKMVGEVLPFPGNSFLDLDEDQIETYGHDISKHTNSKLVTVEPLAQ